MRLPARLAFAIPMAVVAGYAIFQMLRFTRAETLARQDTLEALQKAVGLAPGDADYYARMATLDSSRDDELSAALKLNPRKPSWWIMRAVHQEEDGDLAGAEQSLRRANAVSQYYIPRWSLAAFYYRQGNRHDFVRWARKALSVGYGAPESLFRMAQKLGLSPEEALQTVVPKDPERVDSYLRFLLRAGDMEPAYATATQLIDVGSSLNRESIFTTCETLFVAGKIDEAVALWNKAGQAHWIAFRQLDPATGKSVSNENFAEEKLQRGFDWRYSTLAGVAASQSEPNGGLRLEFSGSQPEKCELMSQYIPLLPGRSYKLAVRYHSEGIPPESGLRWSILTIPASQAVVAGLMTVPGAQRVEQAFDFQTPPQRVPMRIVLAYSRSSGTTRIEGRLWIESVKLTLAP